MMRTPASIVTWLVAVVVIVSLCRGLEAAAANQCTLLYALYRDSANPSGWRNASGWSSFSNASSSSSSCCSWFGIACDSDGTIISISLASNNISSKNLPEEWGRIDTLVDLDVSINAISGTLPSSYSNLKRLESINFAENLIGGTLPSSWSTMSSLATIFGAYNHLVGSIPSSWSNMTSLLFFGIGHNHLSGPVPPLSACRLALCGNYGINGSLQDFPWTAFTANCPNVWIYFFATSITGTIPCIPKVTRLEVSYTKVSGPVPCCSELLLLGAEGTNLSSWSNCSGKSPPLQFLYLSDSKQKSIPVDLGSQYPHLRQLTMRNAQIVQEFPDFPPTLEVLDVGGNSFFPRSTTSDVEAVNLTVASTFRMIDITSTTSSGITLSNINFTCANSNVSCVVRTGVFTALGTQNQDATLNIGDAISTAAAAAKAPTIIEEVSFLDPMASLLPDNRVLVHIMYDFMSVDFSCMYNPILHATGALDGSAIPPSVIVPVPPWNSTYLPVAATPSTIMLFTGLTTANLLFGVNYEISMVFVYRPVRLASTGKLGTLRRSLHIGTVSLPSCNAALYGVPYTVLCIGCPENAICNGSSALFAMDGFWRVQSGVLPFYECDSPGCQNGALRQGSECASGYTGPLCAVCSNGFGRDTSGLCVECSSNAWNVSVIIIGSIVLFAFATFVSIKSVVGDDSTKGEKDDKPSFISERSRLLAATSVKKIQSHMGLYALVGRLALMSDRQAASKALQAIQQVASQFSLRSVSFVSCLSPGFTVVTQFQALLAVVPCLLLVQVLIVRIVKKKWAFFSVISSLCLLLYDMSVNIALLLVPIDDFTFFDATQYSVNRTFVQPQLTLRVLSMDRQVQSSDASSWRVVAFVWLAVFGIGFPGLVVGVIQHYFNTGRRHLVEEQFGFLTSTYRRHCWYWEQVIVLRKLALAVVVVGLKPYPLTQAQGLLVVLMVYVILMEATAPFATTVMHNAERCTCAGAVLLVNVVMATASSQASDMTANDGLSIFNIAIQYIALLVLIVLLVIEWINRSSAADNEDPASPTAAGTRAKEQAALDQNAKYTKAIDMDVFDSRQSPKDISGPVIPLEELVLSFGDQGSAVRVARSFSFNRVRDSPKSPKQYDDVLFRDL